MKTEINKKLNRPENERASNLIYFFITLRNKDHEKKTLHMVAKLDFVLKMIESHKETLKQDSNYLHQNYYGTSKILLQPRVNIHELFVSVFNCICCSPKLDKSNCREATTIFSEINLDSEEIKISANNHLSVKYPGPYLQVRNSELSIPLVSRLEFLSSAECAVLFGTAFNMMDEKVSNKKFTQTQLSSFAKEENNEFDISGVNKILNNLVYYEFFNLPPMVSNKEEKDESIEITLCDLNKWIQGKQKGGGKIFD